MRDKRSVWASTGPQPTPATPDDPIEELRSALDDPRWTQELYLIGAAVVALADRLGAHHA